ncbi:MULTISPECIES: hypothetical protein [unclassified Staphylococcus]|uniref:hypothetical protein n=1 Tax=unclassified Staphylococcus TaxID=91994 RepID=UPI0008A8EF3C|nr:MULTISPECIES: hypothetical protein [unclassified Staphylococcus]OHP76732.1 hypothetical protein HMPREF2585_02220 [Staphylococcus sp. HMSC062D12]OHS38262.1 hypothetical protein HMPREF3267_08305 [Staphylococcus sp. HMSC62D11]
MTETIKTNQHYYTKDFSSYGNDEDNFVANQELTVTITLNEYRKFIETKAVKDKEEDTYRHKYWKEEEKNKKLKEENIKLKNKIYELQNEEEDEREEDVDNEQLI